MCLVLSQVVIIIAVKLLCSYYALGRHRAKNYRGNILFNLQDSLIR